MSIVELLGSEVHVVCRVGEARLVVRQEVERTPARAWARTIRLRADPAGIHVFDAASGARLPDSEI